MTRPIDRIIIPTYAGDFHMARICLASIRHWEGDIPVTLLKDVTNGDFDTSDAETLWNADTMKVSGYGTSSAKIEAFFLPDRRLLVIDADTVLIGPLATHLSRQEGDIVVNAYPFPDPRSPQMAEIYYNYDALMSFDPAFKYPGYVFNAGHFVVTPGLVERREIEVLYSPATGVAHPLRPDIFPMAEQSILNYLWPRLAQDGRLTISCDPFSLNGHPSITSGIDFGQLLATGGIPKLIHWPGPKPERIEDFSRGDILLYFQNKYYSRLPSPEAALRLHTRRIQEARARIRRMRRVYTRLPGCIRPAARRALALVRGIIR